MAAPVKSVPPLWPDDVLRFAAEHKAETYLEPLLDATRRIFASARWIRAYVQADTEQPDERSLVLDVKIADLSPADASRARRQWNEDLSRICPSHLAIPIVLLLDLGR
jgi:hypothetical protein